MKCVTLIFVMLIVTVSSASASDAVRCAQSFLNEANFNVGEADGQLGRRSRGQAELLRQYNSSLRLPELSNETAAEWCAFSATEAGQALIERRRVIDTVAMTDANGPKRLWQAFDDASHCDGPRGEPDKLSLRSKDIKPFDSRVAEAMRPIFPPVDGARICHGPYAKFPRVEPVVEITTGDTYGAGMDRINQTAQHLADYLKLYSYDKREVSRDSVAEILTAWAAADGFSKRLRLSRDKMEVKFDALEVMPLFIIAFSEVGPAMELEDRVEVGKWLRRLVGEVQYSAWSGGQRQDNKNYLRNYITLLWGILTDDATLREAAIEEYKNAIYDMRPDGSFPRDSSRGGSGLHYGARATMMLFAIAHTAKLLGEDLFSYSTEGRSLHTAINWVAVSAQFPDLNTRHATACAESSTEGSTVERPDMLFVTDAIGVASIQSWARVYANSSSADPAIAERLLAAQIYPTSRSVREAPLGGYFSCFASGVPGQLGQ